MPKSGHTEEQIVAVLRQVEAGARVDDEVGRLKRLVADLSLDRQILQDIVSKKL